MKFKFPIAIVDDEFQSENPKENTRGAAVRALAAALEAEGQEVQRIAGLGDSKQLALSQARVSAFLIGLGDGSAPSALHDIGRFITEVRARNADLPLYLCAQTRTSRDIPNEILKELHGFIHLDEDTPDFIAKHILHETQGYVEAIAPPFFKALLNYTQNGKYSWHCPGHSGGVAYLKSPVGRMFHSFYGENMLRSDVCNAVEELGQLLDHNGAIGASEKNAARIFGADHLYFVTNGTSTSNKIVWHSTVGPDDIVVVDRNCHKSNLHAIMMTGATPVFLTPTRNHYGIIGPISKADFSIESIRKKIEKHPFIKDKTKKPRILTLTQSTYDGILYNVEEIKKELDGKIDALHFDEAWLPHAAFHPFYENMHAIGPNRPRAKESLIYSTQSTHKMLAGLSQASQILVNDSESRKLNHHVFNEAYLMHTSTSPLYSIIASCDVAAQMMEGPAGRAMIEDVIFEATEFRRAMNKVEREWAAAPQNQDWWFKVWGPEEFGDEAGGIGDRHDWILKPNESWHGFKGIAGGFNMLDPMKVTVLTPGLALDGEFSKQGIPAALVAKYMAEKGVIAEKCGLYSFFIMFTIGITKGRWNTLMSTLSQFKDDFDKNQPLGKCLPKFAAANPRYENVGLRDLAQLIHGAYKGANIARMTTEMYVSEMIPAMKPSEAFAAMAHEKIERVEIDQLEGRVTAVLLTPYPPGIPLLIPGEKFNRAIVNYLKFSREFNQQFPGFETDIHGLVSETVAGEKCWFVDCVK